jgi:hypothetical protein
MFDNPKKYKAQIEKVYSDAIKRFAGDVDLPATKVSLIFKFDRKDEKSIYNILLDGIPLLDDVGNVIEYSTRQIRNIKFEIIPKEGFIEDIMCGIFSGVSDEMDIPFANIRIMVMSADSEASKLAYFVFNEKQLIKQVAIDYLLSLE